MSVAVRIERLRWGLALTATLDGRTVGQARATRIADGSAVGVAGPVWRISVGVGVGYRGRGVGIELFAAAVASADGPVVRGDVLRAAGLADAGTTADGDRLWASRRLAERVNIKDGRAYAGAR